MSEVQETQKKNNGLLIALVVLFALTTGIMAYLWSSKSSQLEACGKEKETLMKDMNDMSQMIPGYTENLTNDLKADFKNMLETYDKLKAKDASQSDSINAQKEKIQSLLNQLNSNKKFSANQLYQMRKENETLRNIMKGYVKQIDSLNTLNLQLNSDLETRTAELSQTTADRDNYMQQATQANEKVKKGSKLQAYGFKSTGLRMKLNNNTEETNKAKSTSMVKSLFTIGENAIAEPGRKIVYMQVISPDGRTLQYRSSNTMQTAEGTMAYSDKKEIDYNNQAVEVAIFYSQDGQEFVKGTYKVKIYCDGQLIGSDSFTLK